MRLGFFYRVVLSRRLLCITAPQWHTFRIHAAGACRSMVDLTCEHYVFVESYVWYVVACHGIAWWCATCIYAGMYAFFMY